jgi:hypothetical protein
MRRTLIALTALYAGSCFAQVDPKIAKQCKDARDFVGCVKAFSTPATAPDDGLQDLRGAMKQVAGRLAAGTSLRDSTLTFQPVIDSLALVESTKPDALAVREARRATNLFSIMQSAWDLQIKAKSYRLSQYIQGEDIYACSVLKRAADAFDAEYGSPVINWNYKKGIFGTSVCRVPYGSLPVDYMYPIVRRILQEGSASPEEVARQESNRANETKAIKNERESLLLSDWERELKANPKLREWAESNPGAAKKEMAKRGKKQLISPVDSTDEIVLTNADVNTAVNPWISDDVANRIPMLSQPPTIFEQSDANAWVRAASLVLPTGRIDRYYAPAKAIRLTDSLIDVPVRLVAIPAQRSAADMHAVGTVRIDCSTLQGAAYYYVISNINGLPMKKWRAPEPISKRDIGYYAQKYLCY